LPAAKAALVALMQMTSNAAAAISIINLMAGLRSGGTPDHSTKTIHPRREIGPVLA
jgi:hypothetical protein